MADGSGDPRGRGPSVTIMDMDMNLDVDIYSVEYYAYDFAALQSA
jgi:hypothetical protein